LTQKVNKKITVRFSKKYARPPFMLLQFNKNEGILRRNGRHPPSFPPYPNLRLAIRAPA